MTPAIASEPYWAAAPSRRISMRSIADTGIALRSAPVDPRPIVPFTWTRAVVCRRLPLISTRTWSGPRPRRLAGRTDAEPSAIVVRGKLNEGARRWITCMVSVAPVASICRAVMMSTGTAPSASTPIAREPTVISSEKVRARAMSCSTVPASGLNVRALGRRPAALTRSSSGLSVVVPAGRLRM